MSVQSRAWIPCGGVIAVCASVLPAHADLSIAKMPTSNVSCNAGSCVATAPTAVLNVADLHHLLAKQPAVSVNAAVAKNITVDAALSWASSASLALSASGSLTVNKPITVAGSGSVAIQTADSGLSFAPKANLSFWSLSSGLTINNVSYTLVGDIQTIVNDMDNQIATAFAFAHDYDASADGTYNGPPICQLDVGGNGHLEGLGHTISHLSVEGEGGCDWAGLVGILNGTLTNLHIANARVENAPSMGIAVGRNFGVIDHVSVSGVLGESSEIGGLVGENDATIRNSSAKVNIPEGDDGGYTGGLVGLNGGTISGSWADGTVRGGRSSYDEGGLAGFNGGAIENSYTLANTRFCHGCGGDFAHGGLFGQTSSVPNFPSKTVAAYAAGATAPSQFVKSNSENKSKYGFAGGVVGYEGSNNTYSSVYWITDSSKHVPGRAAGNKTDVPETAGLTEAQLKAALPAGFNPSIWGQSPDINSGYPYLLANPPQ